MYAQRTNVESCSRFPKLQIIVGHLGERISSDLLRIDTRQLPLSHQDCALDWNQALRIVKANTARPSNEEERYHILSREYLWNGFR